MWDNISSLITFQPYRSKDFPKDFPIEISERQQFILRLIHADCAITSEKISEKISEKKPISARTIETDISKLKEMGILAREGGRKGGRWVIIKKWYDEIL